MQEPTFHTVQEVARMLRVDAATIYRSIRAGSFRRSASAAECDPRSRLREVAAKASQERHVRRSHRPACLRGWPPTSLSFDAVARNACRPGQDASACGRPGFGCLAVGPPRPTPHGREGSSPLRRRVEPASDGTEVDARGQQLGRRVVAQRVYMGVDLEASSHVVIPAGDRVRGAGLVGIECPALENTYMSSVNSPPSSRPRPAALLVLAEQRHGFLSSAIRRIWWVLVSFSLPTPWRSDVASSRSMTPRSRVDARPPHGVLAAPEARGHHQPDEGAPVVVHARTPRRRAWRPPTATEGRAGRLLGRWAAVGVGGDPVPPHGRAERCR